MQEHEALALCRAGQQEAYTEIVRRYQARILALALRMTGNRADAADVAQQAFTQAYRHLDRYDPAEPFGPWLYRIATNACIAFLRRRGRHRARASPDAALQTLAAPDPSPAALLVAREDREQIRRAVAELPAAYRTVVVLYYFENLSYRQIAAQTGLSVGTVSTHIYRAKQRLRQALAAKGVEPG